MESGTAVQLPEIMGELKSAVYISGMARITEMDGKSLYSRRRYREDRRGKYPSERDLYWKNFQKRVVATVNTMLKRYIRNF